MEKRALPDRMIRRCFRCRHVWAEAPLDAAVAGAQFGVRFGFATGLRSRGFARRAVLYGRRLGLSVELQHDRGLVWRTYVLTARGPRQTVLRYKRVVGRVIGALVEQRGRGRGRGR
ncbi:hypothetical protein [Streptosporangium sp. NPDC002524]|uniref:hypothetical protein n=1 Tax=Streptosporangium sp. NPDC002524 TaxID=3154537 RepID=UPI00332FABA6